MLFRSFRFLEQRREAVLKRDLAALTRLIEESLKIKAQVVERDEKEGGLRRILNFGHTVGHTLEAAGHFRHFLHGEAVAWGMRAATCLAQQRGLLPASDARRIHSLIAAYGPVPGLPRIRRLRLAGLLHADKKTREGVLHFVLPEAIGRVRVVPGISVGEVEAVLKSLAKE